MPEPLATVAFDTDGFMVDASAWTAEIAMAIAADEGLELTARHWVVINYCRSEWQRTGEAPSLRNITKNTDVSTQEIYHLFPGGPGKVAAKIAGLKKPTGCI